jgi:hypothetical protein
MSRGLFDDRLSTVMVDRNNSVPTGRVIVSSLRINRPE